MNRYTKESRVDLRSAIYNPKGSSSAASKEATRVYTAKNYKRTYI